KKKKKKSSSAHTAHTTPPPSGSAERPEAGKASTHHSMRGSSADMRPKEQQWLQSRALRAGGERRSGDRRHGVSGSYNG
ncbi:unnamed protein product, partial [Urochloa humidicola]